MPGYIIAVIRAQFLTGRRSLRSDAALFEAIALSCVNLAIYSPLLALIEPAGSITMWSYAVGFALLIIGPTLLGLLLGAVASYEVFYRVARTIKLTPVHAMPSAWDWKFTRVRSPGEWVHITLKDDTNFFGWCGGQSFISSDPRERDIYIECVFEVDETKKWHKKGTGLYVASSEVRTMEFWRHQNEENADDG